MPPTTQDDLVLTELRASWQSKHAAADAIASTAAATPELLVKADALYTERDAIGDRIAERQATLASIDRLKSRSSAGDAWAREPQRTLPHPGAQPVKGRVDTGVSEIDRREATGGFKSLGHFAWCQIKQGNDGRGEPSAVLAMKDWNDLQRKAPSGMFEESDPDGGNLIPREFSNQIYTRMVATNQILQYLNPIPLTGNTIDIPALKEDSRVDGSRGGGVLGYWQGEAAQYTKSKPQTRIISLKLHKLTVMTFMTDELMNDSPQALQSYLLSKAPEEINFKINDGVINGNGNGMPLGIANGNSKITVAAVAGQGAGTFIYPNVTAMFARITAGQRKSLVVLYNQDVEPQLFQLYLPTGTAAGVAIFTPNQDGSFNLLGRKAMVMEQCQSLGTAGDVIFFATDSYACATKGGIESFMSMHLRFDYDETCFKWRFRFDGQPYDDVPLTPYKGSNTTSGIVVLNSTRT